MTIKPFIIAAIGLTLSGLSHADVDMRFGHFAPLAADRSITGVDFIVNGTTVESGRIYGEFTGYRNMGPSGEYQITIRASGQATGGVSIVAPFPDGHFSIYLIGDGQNLVVQGLALQDNPTTDPGTAKVQFIHAGAFAASEAETRFDVRTQSGDLFGGLSDLEFGQPTGYFVLSPGSHDFRFTAPDGATLVDPAPLDLEAGQTVTLVVAGDNDRQPLSVTAVPGGMIPEGQPAVDHTGTGIFFSPQTPGQGAQIMVFPDQGRILGFFYTYDRAGQELVWYHFDSCNSAPDSQDCATPNAFDGISAPISIYRAEGGVFNDPTPSTLDVVGQGTVQFQDCDNVTFTATFGNGAGNVTLDYTRLGDRVECSAALSR